MILNNIILFMNINIMSEPNVSIVKCQKNIIYLGKIIEYGRESDSSRNEKVPRNDVWMLHTSEHVIVQTPTPKYITEEDDKNFYINYKLQKDNKSDKIVLDDSSDFTYIMPSDHGDVNVNFRVIQTGSMYRLTTQLGGGNQVISGTSNGVYYELVGKTISFPKLNSSNKVQHSIISNKQCVFITS